MSLIPDPIIPISPLAKPETIRLAFATFETIIFSATVFGRTDRVYSVLRSGSFTTGVTIHERHVTGRVVGDGRGPVGHPYHHKTTQD